MLKTKNIRIMLETKKYHNDKKEPQENYVQNDLKIMS